MADNITLNGVSVTGGKTLASKDVSGVDYQRVIPQRIDAGVPTDIEESNPFPVLIPSGNSVEIATPSPIDVTAKTVGIKISDNSNIDAFGRLRVSHPSTIFDSKLIAGDKAPLFWDEALESGAGISGSTPTAAKPYIDFTSTINTAGVYTRQTFRHFNYEPGKSQLIMMTGVLDLSGGGTGVERRIGYFNDDNGVFFEDDAGTIGVTRRSNDTGTPVDTTVIQSSWNIDAMDGNGPSGITVDFSKAQIFVIDFQWLGVGRVRFGLQIDGDLYYVHEFLNANNLDIPWASTPNLPLRFQIITTGSSPASSMRCICASVKSEGGDDITGFIHSHGTTDHVNATTADTVYALLGIRLKTSHLGCRIDPVSISLVSEISTNHEWMLIFNPTVAGTFTYTDKTNSCVQIATGDSVGDPSTNTVTGGTIIERGYGVSINGVQAGLKNALALGSAIDGTRDTLVLATRPLAANADVQGALMWRETI